MPIADLSHIAFSSAGFRDGLGERLIGFDRSGGPTLDLLRVRPEIAVSEAALVERAELLAGFTTRRFPPLRGVGRDPASGRPIVVSERVEGERLSELLEQTEARCLVPDITVALHVVTEALQALADLDRACGTAHGALGAERLIVTPRGDVIVADHVFAPILERLGFSNRFLWRELRLAMPARPGPARFDARADIAQAAVMLIALTIGRPLLDDEYPDGLAALADEVREIARIRGGDAVAGAVGDWLDAALQASQDRPAFGDAAEAIVELERALPKEAGIIGSREDLQAFLDEIAEPEAGVVTPAEIDAVPPQQITVAEEPPAPFEFTVPPLEAPPLEAPPCDAPPAAAALLPVASEEVESVPLAEDAPAPAPRRRLISDVDVSLLPDWMIAPEADVAPTPPAPPSPSELAEPPAPAPQPESPAPPSVASWLDTGDVPVREDVPPEVVAVESVGPVEDLGEEPAPEPDVAVEARREVAAPPAPRRTRRLLVAAGVLALVAAGTAAAVRWLATNARPGTVIIESTPAGSEVLIDGQKRGTTPVTIELAPGRHTLELRRRNRTRTLELAVAPGAEVTQSFDWGAIVDTGALRVTSDPDGARVSVDGRPRGQTPLDLADLAVGRHAVVVSTDTGSVTSQVTVAANETTTLHVPVYSGWLAVFAPVELQILERGRLIGTSGQGRLMVAPGRHEIELVNEDLGFRSTEALDVRPGETASLSVEPKGQVNLNAVPWAEVFVDGERLGETPMANVSVTIGTREFIFRHPELGERRVTAVVTLKETALVNVDLTKGPAAQR